MEPAFKNLSDKFAFLDKLHHLNKLSLFVVISLFAAIPVTVFGIVTLRQIDPQAASGTPTSLNPSGAINITDPTFSWDCFCYTTLYRIHVREADGNFYAGDWYKDVPKGSSNITTTSFTGFSNNNYKTPIPGSLTVGKTYYWTVSCVTGGCNTAQTQSVTVARDTVKPTTPANFRVVSKDTTGITFAWSPSTDNIGIKEYTIGSSGIFDHVSASTTTYKFKRGVGGMSEPYILQAWDLSSNSSIGAYLDVTQPDRDYDLDGFLDSLEFNLSTSWLQACGGPNSWPPDLNGDRIVDATDQQIVASKFGTGETRADFNRSGRVDSLDLQFLAKYLGRTC